MKVPATAASGLHQPAPGLQKATDEIARTANPVDAVHLSREAFVLSQQQVGHSIEVTTMKVKDEISNLAINVIG
jgi:hypothetical protein